MNLLIALLALTTAVNGWHSGLNVDTALVKLLAHRRIGVVAYATFARGNDLRNGLFVYPLLGIRAVLLTALASVLTWAQRSFLRRLLLISFCSRESVWCVSLNARARRRKIHESF